MKLSYTILGKTVRIDKIEDQQQVVIIPDILDGYPVTELGNYVLAGSSVEESGFRQIWKKSAHMDSITVNDFAVFTAAAEPRIWEPACLQGPEV